MSESAELQVVVKEFRECMRRRKLSMTADKSKVVLAEERVRS